MDIQIGERPLQEVLGELTLTLPQLDAIRHGIELYGATRFSPFAIFSPNENVLSRVITELFDPGGSHGQGLLFLNSLLSAIGIPRVGIREKVSVKREVLTRARRRIDIVIETPTLVIGIENKPWAVQQPNQLSDYLAELSADLRGRRPVLIFLSDQEEQSALGSTVKVPYYSRGNDTSLHGLLASTVGEVKALRPKQFVEDFISYIEGTFGDGQLDDAADKPYIEAVEGQFDDPSKRKAVATVLLTQETLHLRILDEVGDYLLSQVQEHAGEDFTASGEATISACLYQQYQPWGVRRPSWPANCEVAVESQKYFFTEVKFGVKAPDGKRLSGDALAFASQARLALDKIAQEIPGGRRTLYWPWEQALSDPYWGQEFAAKLVIHSPTGLVQDHSEVKELGRKFVEMALAVDKLMTS